MAALVDTNVLVYRHDPRYPVKRARAEALLRKGIEDQSARIAHQAVVEFMAAVSRPLPDLGPLLTPLDARRETEELLRLFPVLYPDAHLVRVALQGMAAYELSWWDAHMWAYAEVHGLDTLYSEDFQDGRWYGSVRVVNPFLTDEGDEGKSAWSGT
ncbi:MAG: PIN domain-containing protein [Gemmatimonadetes bacterium]|nr:PIN domain-containing protein [Gemmatimonadota bacterium]